MKINMHYALSVAVTVLFTGGYAPSLHAEANNSLQTESSLQSENDRLSSEVLNARLSDKDAQIRLEALRNAEPFVIDNTADMEKIIALVHDGEEAIRLEATKLLRFVWVEKRVDPLLYISKLDGANEAFQGAIRDASKNISVPLITNLTSDTAWLTDEKNHPLLSILAQEAIITDKANYATVQNLLSSVPAGANGTKRSMLLAFATGAVKSNQLTILKQLASTLSPTGELMQSILEEQRGILQDAAAPLADRINAASLLSVDSYENSSGALVQLITQTEPLDLQSASLRALSKMGNPAFVPQILKKWSGLSPEIRQQAMFVEFKKEPYLLAMLDTIRKGEISIETLVPWGVNGLTQHSEILIRNRAKQVLAQLEKNQHTEDVQETYQRLRAMQPDIENGKKLYMENCSICHRFDGEGKAVGPDLDAKAQQGVYTILKKLLYPNDQALTFYYSYTVETADFEQFTGLIAEEAADSLLIRGPGGEENRVTRDNIDSLSCSEKTLMPEGWRDGLGEQGLADLTAYLVQTEQKKKLADSR